MGDSPLELIKHFSNTCAIASVAVVILIFLRRSQRPNLDAFPTVGSNSWLGSWRDSMRYSTNAIDVIQKGYEKHKGAPFKIVDLFHWMVIMSCREHIEEIVRATEEELSLVEATNDRHNTRYTLGNDIHDDLYQVGVIRTQLTRNIGTLYSDIRDEIVTAFDELLDLGGGEWKSISASNLAHNIVCRSINRVFVGLPLCRDPDWVNFVTQYAVNVGKAGFLLGFFPRFIRPLAIHLFPGVTRGVARSLKYLGAIIDERLKDVNESEDEKGAKHNDLVAWLIEEASGPQLMPKSLASRILFVNVAAIHTTSNSFAHALFYLAEHPQYVQPLREEVEGIIEKEGWSKVAVSKMRKVDSFLRECQRLKGMEGITISRKALKDVVFKDGTFIPKGTLVGVPTRSLHYDGTLYEDPNTFRPFRFVDMHGEDEESVKGQFVSTATDYLAFGHGRHTCPGRVFAVNELKVMLAHAVVAYDIKLQGDPKHSHSVRFGTFTLADPHKRVLFRRRV